MALTDISLGRDAATAVAECLGLDPARTRSVTIQASYDDFVIAVVELFVEKNQIDALIEREVITKFRPAK